MKNYRSEVIDVMKMVTWLQISSACGMNGCTDLSTRKVYQCTNVLTWSCRSGGGDFTALSLTDIASL